MQRGTVALPTVPHPGRYRGPGNHSPSPWEPPLPQSSGPGQASRAQLSLHSFHFSVSLAQVAIHLLRSYNSGLLTGLPLSPSALSGALMQSVQHTAARVRFQNANLIAPLFFIPAFLRIKEQARVSWPLPISSTLQPAQEAQPSFSSLGASCPFLSQQSHTHFISAWDIPTMCTPSLHTPTPTPNSDASPVPSSPHMY